MHNTVVGYPRKIKSLTFPYTAVIIEYCESHFFMKRVPVIRNVIDIRINLEDFLSKQYLYIIKQHEFGMVFSPFCSGALIYK